jgi:hypothetical protein
MSAAASAAFFRWVSAGGDGDPAGQVAAALDVLMDRLRAAEIGRKVKQARRNSQHPFPHG